MNYVAVRSAAESMAKALWANPDMQRNLKDVAWNGIQEQRDLAENLNWKLAKELKLMEKHNRDNTENLSEMLSKHVANISDPKKVVPIRESVKTSLFE
ncbi:hypothetical protein EVJ24_14930 [Exiguobacterium sp. SH1S21]|uniref:hypothetical protein n=1 Tax=Exiguobacterium sp. SH1S21 TaxID=2510953 RepID=UPI0010406DE5|nr:hypothetical protein [Exiguobacterium sp. SH1S21]TCI50333.1 hypothetical protein EVJ24_14930 [Exiguobacterium sp. SH1S21]